MDIANMLPLLIPLIVVEFGMRIVALISILNAEKNEIKLRFDSKIAWILIVLLVNFGWVIYFIIGKVDE